MVNLNNDLGLSNGDNIDSYIKDALGSGEEITCNAGTYDTECDWSGFVNGDHINLAGSGVVTLEASGGVDGMNPDMSSGTVTIEGFTLQCDGRSGKIIRPQIRDSAKLELFDVHIIDNDGDDDAMMYLNDGEYPMSGTVHISNCYFEGGTDNCLYMDKTCQAPGGLLVENSVFRNHDVGYIRMGGGDDVIRGCLFIADGDESGIDGNNHDFVRSRNSSRDGTVGSITMENCEMIKEVSGGSPFVFYDPVGDYDGSITNIRIRNETDSEIVSTRGGNGGNVTFDDIHITGSGSDELEDGPDYRNIETGSSANEPQWSVSEVLGTSSIGGGSGGSSGGGDNYDYLTVHADSDEYTEIVIRGTGTAEPTSYDGSEADTNSPADTVKYDGDEFECRAYLSGAYDPVFSGGDAFRFLSLGEQSGIKSVSSTEPARFRLNGNEVSIDEIVDYNQNLPETQPDEPDNEPDQEDEENVPDQEDEESAPVVEGDTSGFRYWVQNNPEAAAGLGILLGTALAGYEFRKK
jgi:hypothetical protein